LLRAIGISYAIEYLQRFGFNKARLPKDLSLALGSAAVTPMELVTAYSVFANGGYKVEPYFIDRIVTDEGEVVYVADPEVVCRTCEEADNNQENPAVVPVGNDSLTNNPTETNGVAVTTVNGQAPLMTADGEPVVDGVMDQPKRPRVAKRVVAADNVYIMTTIMKDVIQKGTGRRARALGRYDIAGKTGTTNDQRDAWFSGFTPDVVTTAWVGFDTPKPLGDNETGGHAALPMWVTYMREALRGLPERQHERPPGLVNVRIDPATGLLAGAGQQDGVFEIFRVGHVPGSSSDGLPDADLGGSNVDGGPQSVSPGTRNDGEDQLF
jgi:penicillin-binding protein 1A